jgi:tetratricopeptide (TPR) repeat protein
MLEWSYDLLSAPERVLLHRLSVFAGGWTLAAAEAICSDFGLGNDLPAIRNPKTEIENEPVLDLLTRLVDKSLVVYEQRHHAGRYRLLETIRQFARERPEGSGESEAVRRRHAKYYMGLAEAAEPHLIGQGQQVWLERLEQERDNLPAALGWAVAVAASEPASDAGALGLRLAAAVFRFWHVRSAYVEGRDWLARLLGLLDEETPRRAAVPLVVRARALCAAGSLAFPQGDGQAAKRLLQESLSLARELGDRPLIAQALNGLGNACHQLGEFELAQHHFEDGLAVCQELGDRCRIAVLYNNLGMLARQQGKYERARPLVEESLRIAREAGEIQSTSQTLFQLGILHTIAGDYPKALASFEESMAVARNFADQTSVARAHGGMGTLARYQGDLVTARARYQESFRISQVMGGHEAQHIWLTGLGCVEIMSGETAGPKSEAGNAGFCRGTRLLGAAEARRLQMIWPWDQADYERCVAVARAALGEEAFAAAWAEGRAMSRDEAAAYALAEDGKA